MKMYGIYIFLTRSNRTPVLARNNYQKIARLGHDTIVGQSAESIQQNGLLDRFSTSALLVTILAGVPKSPRFGKRNPAQKIVLP